MSFPIIDSGAAAAIIPTEQAAQVIAAAAQQSVALRLCRRARMTTRDLEQPVLSQAAESYWIRSGELKQLSSAAWAGVSLRAEELATIVVADIDVVEDASIDIWTSLRDEFATAIATKLDAAVLAGDDRPDSWPPSIVEGAAAAGQVVRAGAGVAAGGVYGDLAALLDELEGRGVDPTGWCARRALRGLMRRARAADGQLLGDFSLNSAWDLDFTWAIPGTLPGSTLVIAGEWPMAIVGVRQDMRVEFFKEGVLQGPDGEIVANLLQQDRVAARVTFRVGYAVANPVRRTEGDSERSFPFAVLEQGAGTPANGGGGDSDQEPEEAAAPARTRTPAKKS
jgi:HK97 family phage major capsid protein